MERIFSFLTVLFFTVCTQAQVPDKLSYQAVVRNESGKLVQSSPVGVRISILQSSHEGTVVYSETHDASTNTNGLVTIEIGGGQSISGDFSTLDWSAGPYFIKTETDPAGGTNYTITGTSQLLSVPYALHAKTVGSYTESDPLFSSHITSSILPGDITNWNTAHTDRLKWNGGSSGLDAATGRTSLELGSLATLNTVNNSHWSGTAILSSVDGVSNDGGDIDLVAGSNVTITPDDVNNTITISSSGGTGDDLGNHTATENIRLSGNWLSGDGGDEGVYVTGSGSVGIGEPDPATHLHVDGSPTESRGQLSISSPSGEDTFISFYEADNFKAYLWYDDSDDDLRLQNVNDFAGGDLSMNPYGGNVGIGLEDPAYELDVTGDINFTGSLYKNGNPYPGHYIGEFYGGGIIFWLDETGEHGLICAKEDQSSGVRWYAGTSGDTQAKGNGPFSGETNTAIIIAAHVAIGDDGTTYAARICNELQITEGGKTYGDWYLPSREELMLMYQNMANINATATAHGGTEFVSAFYWSSTEVNNGVSWIVSFTSGGVSMYTKSGTNYVRAARAF